MRVDFPDEAAIARRTLAVDTRVGRSLRCQTSGRGDDRDRPDGVGGRDHRRGGWDRVRHRRAIRCRRREHGAPAPPQRSTADVGAARTRCSSTSRHRGAADTLLARGDRAVRSRRRGGQQRRRAAGRRVRGDHRRRVERDDRHQRDGLPPASRRRSPATSTARGGEGSVVHIASIEGTQPAAGHSHYSVSKAALIMHAKAAALELGRSGVRVNAVSPGLIHRDGIEEAWPDGVGRWKEKAPLGRLGDRARTSATHASSSARRWRSGSRASTSSSTAACRPGARGERGGLDATACYIVTGAAGGIGQATVTVLLEEGARVVLTDIDLPRTQAAAARARSRAARARTRSRPTSSTRRASSRWSPARSRTSVASTAASTLRATS